MNSKEPASPNFPLNTSQYSRLADIFTSWFWRYYDNLFRLLLFNLGWFLTCFGIGWLGWRFGFAGSPERLNLFGIYSLFLVELIGSICWAFLVFKIFNEGHAPWGDLWPGLRKYFWKAFGVSALSGLLMGLALYNIYFYFHLQSEHRFLDLLLAGFIFWILLFWISATLFQWPILFFQDPPFWRIFYRSCLLVLGNGLVSLGILAFFAACFFFFTLVPFLWFFIGPVFFFSFQCVVLEKHYLRYKITYGDKPLEPFIEYLDRERQRGWRDILKPWENR